MTVTKLTCSKSDGVSIELPKGFIRQPLSGVNVTEDYSNRYIQGFISERWVLQNRKKLPPLLKFTLDEKNVASKPPSSKTTISVFCFGKLAKEMDQIKKGDLLVIAGFIVEQSTRLESIHPCQLCVDESKQDVQVWIVNVDTKEEPSTSGAVSTRKDTQPKTPDYIYTTVDSIQANTSVSIFAVVKFFKPPYQTRGTDLCQVFSVVDPTCEHQMKLKCLFFVRPPAEAPPVKIGSIVRFHRLKIIYHNGELQGNNGPGFSWLVFEGQEGGSLEPKSSSAKFTITDKDRQQVEKLRKWSSSNEEIHSVIKPTSLSDIIPGKYINVCVQVVSTCVVEPGVCFLLRVWDGTKCLYPVREVQTDSEVSEVNSDEILLEAAQGLLYDVCLFDDHFKTGTTIKPGDIVELRNLHAAVYKNAETREEYHVLQTVELAIHRGTSYGRGVVKVPLGNTTITELVKSLDKIKETVRQNVVSDNRNQERNDNNNKTENRGNSNIVSAIFSERLNNSVSNSNVKTRLSDRVKNPSNITASVSGIGQNKTTAKTNFTSGRMDVKNQERKRPREPDIQNALENVGFDFKKCALMENSSPKRLKEACEVQKSNAYNSIAGSISEKDGKIDNIETAGFEFPNALCDSNESQNSFQNGFSSPELQLSCDPVSDLGSRRSPEISRCMMETATIITAHHHINPVSLSEVISHSVPYKFRVLVKLMDYKPKLEKPRDLIKLYCASCHFVSPPSEDGLTTMICPRCVESSSNSDGQELPTLEHIYMVKFLLGDGITSIEVHLWRDDAVTFFRGLKPDEVLTDLTCFKAIQEDLDKLSGTEESKPWLECCVKSYNGPSRTCYQIFDTTIA